MADTTKTTFKAGNKINSQCVILELLGQGGMGEVYRAHQLNLKRDVAVKVVSKRILEDIGDNEYEANACMERFRREVRLMAQVKHPNVLQIFDHGSVTVKKGKEASEVEYIIMELVQGSSLRSTMSMEGFYPDEDRVREWLAGYFVPVLNGVSALHSIGIIHRDLKPENILFDGTTPKIMDFGLARSTRLEPVTQSMDIKGTPPYMSPEHFLDLRRADERSDVYSLGKILYEAVSGKITSDEIPFKQACLKDPKGPFFKALDSIIRDSTIEHKNERMQSVDQLKAAVEKALHAGSEPVPMPAHLESKRYLKFFLVLIFLPLIAGLIVSAYDRGLLNIGTISSFTAESVKHDTDGVENTGLFQSKKPPISGRDNAVLHFIPAGNLPAGHVFGQKGNKPFQIESFYLDETLVTNYQYIEFLNDSLSRITIKGDMVTGDGRLWLLLGEVVKGYQPIIYENGKFRINGTHHSSCPVLRVTAYGASAYALHYGKRLPTQTEWAYIVHREAIAKGASAPHPQAKIHPGQGASQGSRGLNRDSAFPTPVLSSEPDTLGIRGLNGNIAEWGTYREANSNNQEYVVLGGHMNNAESMDGSTTGIKRQPWESAEEIGFRTALDLPE